LASLIESSKRTPSKVAAEAQVPPQRPLDAMLLVQAMVAAAAADGVIDEAEKGRC